ncbi:MAG: hypothetical protein ACJ72X_02000 [Nitrososphaeraceae archaeon]
MLLQSLSMFNHDKISIPWALIEYDSAFRFLSNKAVCFLKLSGDTEERFRKAISNSKGMKKGNISIAIEEAIDLWIEEQKRKERSEGKR